jgi:DNA-binding response OmpR family regulator
VAHVLVVDDEADLRLLLRINFESRGHRVSLAEDGEAALRQVRTDPPDVVVLDVMMPVLDGWGVLAALRDAGAQVPVSVVSARHDVGSVRRAYELGADQLLAKPFELDALVQAVEALVGRPEEERRAARAALLAALP